MPFGKEDKELQEYREIMSPPEKFEDGFDWKTVVGAVFLGFVMMPGSMYLRLYMGTDNSIGSAARWVTIILFAEVARRSLKELKQQEIYVLYFMAGLALGSPFEGYLWRQALMRSEFAQAMGIAQQIPNWYVPALEVVQNHHTLFRKEWIAPIALTMTGLIISRIDGYGLGYILYRIANDVEELPFPMAPVAAQGILALSHSREEKEKWRWRCFSIGGMIGLLFGAIYIALPVMSGAILMKPITLIPVPWVDLTPAVGKLLPAAPFNLTFDMRFFLIGMVIPFWAVIGGFLGVVFTMMLNPLLYRNGVLTQWQPGTGFVDTVFLNNIDFYLSFGIGLTLAITLVSLGKIVKPLLEAFGWRTGKARDRSASYESAGTRLRRGWRRLVTNNVERGDFSIFIALGIYVFTSTFWIVLSTWLIDGFPWHFFVFYALVYTPLISYATAKLEGLCGQVVDLPYIREATYILSGYKGVAIWFAPVPLRNLGVVTVRFRILELCGTKIKSQIKAMLVTIPIIVVASLLFSELLWRMSDVPSEAYPFAQKMWDLQIKNLCVVYSSTLEGGSLFMEALKLKYILWGLGSGTISFIILSLMGLPTLLVFGLVRGLGQGSPGGLVLELIGALVGRFYFRRRFGKRWLKFAPVILAGFSCGMGLIAMVALGFRILAKMMKPLVF